MAIEHEFEMYGHPSIYQPSERKLKIYFNEPSGGINRDTGIVLLIPGFGASSKSNVYKKMRREFADKYNLVTVQCDFFGFEFLQNVDYFMQNYTVDVRLNNKWFLFNAESVKDIFQLLRATNSDSITLKGRVRELQETPEYCCDLGVMQALDNITAIMTVISIIEQNGYTWNKNKVILYGTSHGSYISYLCNAFAPFLFTLLVDCSAYTFPSWYDERTTYSVYTEVNSGVKVQLDIDFKYIIGRIFGDRKILSLPNIYSAFNNRCRIISYHGTNDELTSIEEKMAFCNSILNCTLQEITTDTLKGQLFKTTTHNLSMDLLDLFDYVLNNHDLSNCDQSLNSLNWEPSIIYKTDKFVYHFDYSSNIPVLTVEET